MSTKDRFDVVFLYDKSLYEYKDFLSKKKVYIMENYWEYEDVTISVDLFREDNKFLISDYLLRFILHNFHKEVEEKLTFKENVFHSIGDSFSSTKTNISIKDALIKGAILKLKDIRNIGLYSKVEFEKFSESYLPESIKKSSRRLFPIEEIFDLIKDEHIIPMNEKLLSKDSMYLEDGYVDTIEASIIEDSTFSNLIHIIISGFVIDNEGDSIFLFTKENMYDFQRYGRLITIFEELTRVTKMKGL